MCIANLKIAAKKITVLHGIPGNASRMVSGFLTFLHAVAKQRLKRKHALRQHFSLQAAAREVGSPGWCFDRDEPHPNDRPQMEFPIFGQGSPEIREEPK